MRRILLLVASLGMCFATVQADNGKLAGTAGASQLEGSAGGGLVPWGVLSGYGTNDQNGATAFISRVDTGDFSLSSVGAAYTIRNRVELSAARNVLDLGTLGNSLGLPDAVQRQHTFGAKLRITGNAVYTARPEVAVGVMYKDGLDAGLPTALGARDTSGVDYYLAATKAFLGVVDGHHLLVNGTIRRSEANELGLLGFGGPAGGRETLLEASAAVMLDHNTVIGMEYRQKPDNLGLSESDWRDVFIAWFPSKRLSLTAAYVDLGTVGGLREQTGFYLSVQAAF